LPTNAILGSVIPYNCKACNPEKKSDLTIVALFQKTILDPTRLSEHAILKDDREVQVIAQHKTTFPKQKHILDPIRDCKKMA